MKFNKYVLNKDFIFKNNQVYLTSEGIKKIKRLKKITGSRLGALLGENSFQSPFQLWCSMFGFYEEEFDEYFINAGRKLESKLLDYAKLKQNLDFKSYDPAEMGFDLFPNSGIFGGIPDGEEFDEEGNVVSIIEIKTAQFDKYKFVFKDNQFRLDLVDGKPLVIEYGGGLKKWFRHQQFIVPKSYQYQLSLYLYLRNITKGYFCVAFIKEKDYENPDAVVFSSEFNNYSWDSVPTGEHLLVWQEFNLDVQEFSKKLEQAKEWYENHILKYTSPVLSDTDLTWFRFGYPSLY